MNIFKYLPVWVWCKWAVRTIIIRRSNPTIRISPNTEIARNCRFGVHNVIYESVSLYDVEMGDFTYIGGNSHIQYAKMGRYCSIAPEVRIGLGIHPMHLKSTHPAFYSKQGVWGNVMEPDLDLHILEYKPVTIGDDVWIGTRAIVMDGVTIGSHAVIGAGAVVTGDVPEYAVAVGVPAKVIKYRQRMA